MTDLIAVRHGTSAPAFSDDRLKKVEKSLSVAFPQDYIKFMSTRNGGVPLSNYFCLGKEEKVVERLLSMVDNYKDSDSGIYDIEVVWSQIEGRLNDSLVPFAVLFSGDFICFDFSDRGSPSVVLWDHDRSRENSPVIITVASSFTAFAGLLHD